MTDREIHQKYSDETLEVTTDEALCDPIAAESPLYEREPLFSLPDRYECSRVLGRGGAGIVLKAFDRELMREVAVKILVCDGANNYELQQRFLREARAVANLTHENIVKILASELTEEGEPYHVMEFLEGQSLASALDISGRLSTHRTLELMSQVLDGLQTAHRQGIIHRDLKPGNIMLCLQETGGPIAKLIDFGIARTNAEGVNTQTVTRAGSLLGSPRYMSPEQCQGMKADQRSDIYAVGCIMFECLTGMCPFDGATAVETMFMHIGSPPRNLENEGRTPLARRMGRLIDRCLEKNPNNRPQTAAEILSEIRALHEEAATSEDEYFPLINQNAPTDALKPGSNRLPRVLTIVLVIAVLLPLAISSRAPVPKAKKPARTQAIFSDEPTRNAVIGIRKKLQLYDKEKDVRFKQQRMSTITDDLTASSRTTMSDETYKQLVQLYDHALKSSKSVDDEGTFRFWLLIGRADCHEQQMNYPAAKRDLQEAEPLVASHPRAEWNFYRSRLSLNLSLKNWSAVERDLKLLPSCWKRNNGSMRLYSSMVQGSPLSLTDQLNKVYLVLRDETNASPNEAAIKIRIIDELARLYLTNDEPKGAQRCVKLSSTLVPTVPDQQERDELQKQIKNLALEIEQSGNATVPKTIMDRQD